jgi:hypothetical protein
MPLLWWHYTRLPALPVAPQWLQLIIANRPKHGEEVQDLIDINDIRNGVFANYSIHIAFDRRDVAILKVSHLPDYM